MEFQFSYSRYSTYQRCPAKFKFSYIEKLQVPAIPSIAADRGTLIHKTIEDHLNSVPNAEVHEDIRQHWGQWIMGLRVAGVKPEVKWAFTRDWQPCDFEAPDYWVRGVWDGHILRDKKATVYDWKTGREYDSHKDQAYLYAMAAMTVHPEVDEVDVHFVYLDAKRSTPRYFSRSMYDIHKAQWISWLTAIENETLWPPRPDYTCRWCPFARENNGPCRL